MSTPQPYAGISAQRLVDLINAKNNTNYQLGVDFTLGAPQNYVDSSGRNTQVLLTPVSSTYEAEEIHYFRLPLTALNSLPQGYVSPVPIPAVPFTLSGMLSVINTALGLNLTADEIVDQTYSVQQDSYALPINNATCLAWVDSDFTFTAQFPNTGGGGGTPFVAVRPSWFTALAGMESSYYPVTVGANTLAAPASETAGGLTPSPAQWWNATGNLQLGGTSGAFFDVAVIDPNTGLPAATQPTWSVDAQVGLVYPSGTLQGFGYSSIYTDVEPTLILTPPTASINATSIVITGTYADNSTITGTMTLPPSLNLGDPMNLTTVPVPGYGLVMGAAAYVNKDGKVFNLNPKLYPNIGIYTGAIFPAALVGQTVDNIWTYVGQGYPLSYIKGTTAYAWFGDTSGSYSQFTVPAGSYLAANDDGAIVTLDPSGNVAVHGAPIAGSTVAQMLTTLPSGVTSLNIDDSGASGLYSIAVKEGVSVWAWGTVWDGSAYTPGQELYTDTDNVVFGGPITNSFMPYYLFKSGLLQHPPSTYPSKAGPPNSVLQAFKRLSSVDFGNGYGITADNNVYDAINNAVVTTTGIYRWAGSAPGYGALGVGFIVDQYGQLNFKDSNGNLVSVPSTVKSRPGDAYAYQYKSYPSGYAQYTGTTIPTKYRKIMGAGGLFVAQGGYTSAVVQYGLFPNQNVLLTNVFEFNPYGLASIPAAGQGQGLSLNLDGSINQPEAGNTIPSANWSSSPELGYKYQQIGTTPNGQSGTFTNNNGWPAIGVQFDGTVTPIGYAAQSLSLAGIYTQKKAAWLSMAPANVTIVANLGALLTTAGDLLWWGAASYANGQSTLSLSDTAYVATNSALVKVCMGTLYCFGLEADGTVHEYDFPWNGSLAKPPSNIISTLPAGFKAYDILNAQSLIFAVSADKQTGYFMDVSMSTPWVPFTLAAPMVDWSYTGGTDENSWTGAYITTAGDVRRLKILAGSPMSLSDTLMVSGFANSSLMVS